MTAVATPDSPSHAWEGLSAAERFGRDLEAIAMGRKYRFADREAAEAAVRVAELELTMHRIALDCLVRDEITWTKRFNAECGTWFEMGIARCTSAHGGIIFVRYFYPANGKPSQDVFWADSWIRGQSDNFVGLYTNSNEETKAYAHCFLAVRELYNTASREK